MKTTDTALAPSPPIAIGAPASLPNFIASNLKMLRKRKGWSQTQLAEQVGLNRGNIASYESGSAEPSICKLLRISNLFAVSTQDITRRDLADEAELALAEHAYREAQRSRKDRFHAYRDRANELSALIESSQRLFRHKHDNLASPCPEAQVFAVQYRQLYELTQQLLTDQQEILREVGCQCD